MRRLLAILMALLLCVAATACGGDDSDDTSTKGSDSSSSDDGGSGTSDDSDQSDAALEAKLLTAADVGEGWTADKSDDSDDESDDDESDDSDPDCIKALDDVEETDSAATAEITFNADDDITELDQTLDSYDEDDLDKVEQEFQQGFDALDNCDDFEMDIEGSTATGSIERVEGAKSYGDKSGVWLMRIEVEGISFSSAFVVILEGNTAMALTYTTLSDTAADDVVPYIDKALAKLAA